MKQKDLHGANPWQPEGMISPWERNKYKSLEDLKFAHQNRPNPKAIKMTV